MLFIIIIFLWFLIYTVAVPKYLVDGALYRPDAVPTTLSHSRDRSTSVGSEDCLHNGVRRWYVSIYFLFPRNHGPVRPSFGQV